MHREFPVLFEDMVRSFHKMVDMISASMSRAREEGGDEWVPATGQVASEMCEASVEESAVAAASRGLAELLVDAARERAAASRPADPVPAEVRPAEVRPAEVRPAEVRPAEVRPAEEVRPHRTLKGSVGIPEDPGPAPGDGEAAEPLSSEEFPPEILWYPALIVPESKLGAEARRALRWLEAKTAAPSPAKDVDKV